ncbi:MAG: SDR family oxidoreductase [Spirochaetia bacterium]|nr:SDR family oxidoreductase [Spirochaetia bacterium]
MGNKIVITGASSEIGLAIARKFLVGENEVVLHGNKNIIHCEKLTNNLNVNYKLVRADFSLENEIEQFLIELKNVDILINGAALNAYGLLSNYSDENIDKMLTINIKSLIKITRAAINQMLIKRKGVIINISSVMAQRGLRGASLYAGTKGFMESMSRVLTAEYGKKGIRINNVAPGPIDSGELKKTREYAEEEVRQLSISKRLGNPEDVANLVYFLTEDKAEFINGKTYAIDGGFNTGI